MRLIDLMLQAALEACQDHRGASVALTHWEALGIVPRPPLGHQRHYSDYPTAPLLSRITGES